MIGGNYESVLQLPKPDNQTPQFQLTLSVTVLCTEPTSPPPPQVCPSDPTPPAGPTGEQLGTLKRCLEAHQAEMKRLLTGALGTLCQRLQVVERRMEELYEQGTKHGNSLALLNTQVGQLARRMTATTKQDLSPLHGLGELRLTR